MFRFLQIYETTEIYHRAKQCNETVVCFVFLQFYETTEIKKFLLKFYETTEIKFSNNGTIEIMIQISKQNKRAVFLCAAFFIS